MTSRFGEKSSILFCTYKSLKCLLDIQLEMPIGFAGVKVMDGQGQEPGSRFGTHVLG